MHLIHISKCNNMTHKTLLKSLQKHCQMVFSRFLSMTIFIPAENTWQITHFHCSVWAWRYYIHGLLKLGHKNRQVKLQKTKSVGSLRQWRICNANGLNWKGKSNLSIKAGKSELHSRYTYVYLYFSPLISILEYTFCKLKRNKNNLENCLVRYITVW
jgi:hypothetical protein